MHTNIYIIHACTCTGTRVCTDMYYLHTESIEDDAGKQTSCTATLIAFCQFRGSAVTVSVVTVQPSLPESLWSNSTEVNGGLELWEIVEISSYATN